MKKLPDFFHEKKLWKKGFFVIGVDEVGRGAFAGPLVVGAVVFPKIGNKKKVKELENLGINDSKKLTSIKREKLAKIIKKEAFFCSIGKVNSDVIDKYSIVKATQIAVRKAIKNLKLKTKKLELKKKNRTKNKKQVTINYEPPTKYYLLIDAFYIKYIKGIGLKKQKAIIHGDEISISIAAASIIAKEYRDKLMIKLSQKHKEYKWDKNKGYGTKDHIKALKQYGKCSQHRLTYLQQLRSC